MSKQQNEGNVYSFTTTPQDEYILRVVEEATEDTDFIFLTERNTLLGQGRTAQIAVRMSILVIAVFDPTLTLAGRPVEDLFVEILKDSLENPTDVGEWFVIGVNGDPADIEDELERVRNEVRRIKNIKEGRVVRVNVESF
jgi:hypothetical protein